MFFVFPWIFLETFPNHFCRAGVLLNRNITAAYEKVPSDIFLGNLMEAWKAWKAAYQWRDDAVRPSCLSFIHCATKINVKTPPSNHGSFAEVLFSFELLSEVILFSSSSWMKAGREIILHEERTGGGKQDNTNQNLQCERKEAHFREEVILLNAQKNKPFGCMKGLRTF